MSRSVRCGVTAADLDPVRSYLYVPGTEHNRLAKSLGRGSDAVIADLEDAVAVRDKAAARETVAAWLARLPATPTQVWVRINAETPADDVAVLGGRGTTGVVVAKADPALLARVDGLLADRERDLGLPHGSFAVIPLIESAAGFLALPAIAAGPRVHRLGIGEADLIGELGLRPAPDRAELLPLRLQVVLASAAAGIAAPVAPTSTDFRDLESFRATSEALLGLGFRGRTTIHPGQVPVVNEAFTPGEEELAAAQRLIDRFSAAGSGVLVDDRGRMVDLAVVRAARETVQRARLAARVGGDS
jgi:citrate lyase subunit beta/citryl-CoA lyase